MIPNFPDLSHAPRGDDNTPIIGGSIGANRILYTLKETAGLRTSPNWDLYLISVYTLARNAYTKGMRLAELSAAVDRDADLYMTFIGAYTNYLRTIQAVVLFYAPDYSVIPKELLREHKEGQLRSEFDALYAQLIRNIPRKLTDLTEDPTTQKYLMVVGGSRFPHKQLPEIIKSIYGGQRMSGMIGTVLLSHCPIDLHLYKNIAGLELLESYTAAVWPVASFGRKLTKEVVIPFNTTTHRLFGDDIHLKPLLMGKQKSELIELATDKRWVIKTEGDIISDALGKFPTLNRDILSLLRL